LNIKQLTERLAVFFIASCCNFRLYGSPKLNKKIQM